MKALCCDTFFGIMVQSLILLDNFSLLSAKIRLRLSTIHLLFRRKNADRVLKISADRGIIDYV